MVYLNILWLVLLLSIYYLSLYVSYIVLLHLLVTCLFNQHLNKRLFII
jgi:hypothetical protein